MASQQTSNLVTFEARYGNNDGAFALLSCPPGMEGYFMSLLNQVDLPDSAPPGSKWEPFVRGWTHKEYYLIALTKEDTEAARPGMISTRLLAVSIDNIARLENLQELFNYLHQPTGEYNPRVSFNQVPSPLQTSENGDKLNFVCHHLVTTSNPLANIGQVGFENLITNLWLILSPELRKKLSFGFSFTPSDLSVSQADIVSIPFSLESRWRGYKYKCEPRLNRPLTLATKALLGHKDAKEFHKFLEFLKLQISSFPEFQQYARLWNYWQDRHDPNSDVIYALLRDLGTLIPSPLLGTDIKKEAISLAADRLKNSDAQGILSQRTVKVEAFPDNAKVLSDSITKWVKTQFQNPKPPLSTSLLKVIIATTKPSLNGWHVWVTDGIHQALNPINKTAAQTLWKIFHEEGIFEMISDLLPNDAPTQEVLVQTFPTKINSKFCETIEKWASDRKWLTLWAKSAVTHMEFPETVALICQGRNKAAQTAALGTICPTAEPSEIWTTAFQNTNPLFTPFFVQVALENAELWNAQPNNLKRWLELLEVVAPSQPELLLRTDTAAVAQRIIDAWISDVPVTQGVATLLENAGRLEFSKYSNRSQLWQKIPEPFLARSLSNTAIEWLREYYNNPPEQFELEKELVQVLFQEDHRSSTFPSDSPFLLKNGFKLIEKWGHERACEQWLHTVASSSSTFSEEFAKEVGHYVAGKGWQTIVRQARHYDHDWKRHDLWPIWRIYYDSLGFLDKMTFDYFSKSLTLPSATNRTAQPKQMIDAIFFTALSEEFSAVTAHLSNLEEYEESGTLYEVGIFETKKGSFNVAVVQTGMGNTLSATATEKALSHFKPTYALFVGIAGGLRDDLKIGDVIAADKIYGYEGGKSGHQFKPRPEATKVSLAAVQRANSVQRKNQWVERINPPLDNMPSALVKPIAAGEKVVISKDTEEFRRLENTYSDAHAVAMEEHGFCVAVNNHPGVCFAVIRGISDLIEGKAEADASGSHEIAAATAAAFAFEMLDGLLSTSN